MLLRICELRRPVVGVAWRMENTPGGYPPMVIALTMDVTSIIGQHRIRHFRAIDRGEQAWSECELVTFERQRQRLQLAQGQRRSKVIGAVERPRVFNQALLQGARGGALFVIDDRRGWPRVKQLF